LTIGAGAFFCGPPSDGKSARVDRPPLEESSFFVSFFSGFYSFFLGFFSAGYD